MFEFEENYPFEARPSADVIKALNEGEDYLKETFLKTLIDNFQPATGWKALKNLITRHNTTHPAFLDEDMIVHFTEMSVCHNVDSYMRNLNRNALIVSLDALSKAYSFHETAIKTAFDVYNEHAPARKAHAFIPYQRTVLAVAKKRHTSVSVPVAKSFVENSLNFGNHNYSDGDFFVGRFQHLKELLTLCPDLASFALDHVRSYPCISVPKVDREKTIDAILKVCPSQLDSPRPDDTNWKLRQATACLLTARH
jgi:hypothetical protein